MSNYPVNLEEIREAADRISGWAHRTPLFTCSALNEAAGRQVFLKCENMQRVGAFKFRGAANAVFSLSEEQAAAGVVTHSSGNHAQALALAARLRQVPAYIVMPRGASRIKRRAVEGYGARVIECEPTLADREDTAARVVAEVGAVFIHPYNDPQVIAGQGTVALEILEELGGVDALLAPIGGGGLISGIALAAREAAPEVRVIAAEPAGADDAFRSKRAGRLIPIEQAATIADGLRTSLGELTWPVVRDLVSEVCTVSEEEIVAAMRFIWERTKLLIESSSAVPIAALLQSGFDPERRVARVAVVLSGGNVDLDLLPWQSRN